MRVYASVSVILTLALSASTARAQVANVALTACKLVTGEALRSKKQIDNVWLLLNNNCNALYTKGWLSSRTPGLGNPAICIPAMDALTAAGVLNDAQIYVNKCAYPNIVSTSGCKSISVRKRFNTLNALQKSKFFDTMNKGKSIIATMAKSLTAHFANPSNNPNNPVFSAASLPWHRRYAFQLETELRKIDPNFALPYWDGTDFVKLEDDPVLKDFGGNGAVVGPLQGWNLTRKFNSSLAMTRIEDFTGYATYSSARNPLEALRNDLHSRVGGDLKSNASATDPLFWLTLAYIDKLWYNWQNSNQINIVKYDGQNASRQVVAATDKLADPYSSETVGSVLDARKAPFCYVYEE